MVEELNTIKISQDMKKEKKIKLFLVDDDTVFLKLLEIELLNNADFTIETYATGELCVKSLNE